MNTDWYEPAGMALIAALRARGAECEQDSLSTLAHEAVHGIDLGMETFGREAIGARLMALHVDERLDHEARAIAVSSVVRGMFETDRFDDVILGMNDVPNPLPENAIGTSWTPRQMMDTIYRYADEPWCLVFAARIVRLAGQQACDERADELMERAYSAGFCWPVCVGPWDATCDARTVECCRTADIVVLCAPKELVGDVEAPVTTARD